MSKQKIAILTLTRVATAAILAHQYVGLTGAVAVAGEAALGAATTAAASGELFGVDVVGTTTAIADGAVTDGMPLEVGEAGALTEHDAGIVVAVAMQDAADGELFEVLNIPHGIVPTAAGGG